MEYLFFCATVVLFGMMGFFLKEGERASASVVATFCVISFVLLILLVSKENEKRYSITNNEYQEIEKIEIQGSDTTYYYNIKSK